jgi:formate-nitrite transporter family protein
VLTPELRDAMLEIGREMMTNAALEMVFKGISAGFLITAMVWLIPGAEGTQFHIVTIVTYLIAIGRFTHIVAGNVEAFLLLVGGDWDWVQCWPAPRFSCCSATSSAAPHCLRCFLLPK